MSASVAQARRGRVAPHALAFGATLRGEIHASARLRRPDRDGRPGGVRSGRERAGDHAAHDPHRRAVLSGRQQRRHRARHRRAAVEASRHPGDRREQGRRRRRDRRRLCRQVAARWVGAAAHLVFVPHRGGDADAASVRSHRRVRGGRHGRAGADAAGGARERSLQLRGRSSRRGEGQARRAQLRLGRRRLDRSSRHRAARRRGEGADDARAL